MPLSVLGNQDVTTGLSYTISGESATITVFTAPTGLSESLISITIPNSVSTIGNLFLINE